MTPTHAHNRLPQPRPTVARIVFALTLGTAIAVGLYLWVGRMDPVPPWVNIPPDAKLVASRMNPRGTEMPGMVQYYLQFSVAGQDVKAEMERFARGLDGVQWVDPVKAGADVQPPAAGTALPIRAMTKDDAFLRVGYPKWVQEKMVTSRPMEGAWRLQSQGGMEQIDLYAWPGDAGKCIIELVWKTGGLSGPVEETEEYDPIE